MSIHLKIMLSLKKKKNLKIMLDYSKKKKNSLKIMLDVNALPLS